MRVAIVGGGIAGLTTAWLLQDTHEVMLFEREPRLGGHARTIDVEHGGESVAIDVGAEFFGNAQSYPVFHRLLELLNVQTRSFSATATIHRTDDGRKLVLPPWRRGRVDWSSLTPAGLRDLIRFAMFSASVRRAPSGALRQETIHSFLQRNAAPDFTDRLLIPFLVGQFGMPRAAFEDCLAYDILKYCALAGPFRLGAPVMTEVVGGTRAYVEALARSLGASRIATGTAVAGVAGDGFRMQLILADGRRYDADRVVLATGPSDVGQLCPASPRGQAIRTSAASIDTFMAEVTVHGDDGVLPQPRRSWSVANFRALDDGGALTVWKPWISPTPLFRSWTTGDSRHYRNEYARFRFRHPIGNARYYAAQASLRESQGRDNLWLCGSYVHDNDCHESAVMSAVSVARALAPASARLEALCDGSGGSS
jgi:predicted NAD/FAD-binding protein